MSKAPAGWGRIAVMVVAVVTFVALYEVTMLDSKRAATRTLASESTILPEPGTRLSFVASAYCKGLVTKSGVPVQSGIAAADPALLPVGSVVELETADSRYDGIYTVLDTGPAVQGATVDLYMWSCHEALKFGRRPVALTVLRLGWNPRATAGSFVDRLFGRAAVAADSTLPSRPLPLAP
jgi:3D (Asp-Asp-Asp) domain-containing protein